MKKLLAVLGSISLLTTSTISVVACESPGGKDEKVELKEFNKENVENFFKENRKFKYEGEFIFIDEPSDQEFKGKLPSQSFLEWIFTKTIINEMSKTINIDTVDFYKFYAEIDGNHYNANIDEGESLISGKNYDFKFSNLKIEDTKNNKDFNIKDLEFEFKQTNKVSEDKINNKQLENLTNYWLGGINSSKNNKINPVYANHAAFSSQLTKYLESGDIENAKVELEKGLDSLANSTYLSSTSTVIYEKYRFTSKVKDIKIMPNEAEKYIFAEVTGEATLVENQNVKSKFSANWGFYK
ncbi:lipoprotein [Spiroplasma alleghenense]|uniref:Lipoprotein n=1 Tax=Spiroplasma alleghenense TaxID=216931 RepID=A0A345Z2Y7_9MOLU|nr:lipoprotein [Spiroplasma alleghenense]AXK50966.1 hypothetical protein SALLE_v1c02920 [Spiroplasma alleghenense]